MIAITIHVGISIYPPPSQLVNRRDSGNTLTNNLKARKKFITNTNKYTYAKNNI